MCIKTPNRPRTKPRKKAQRRLKVLCRPSARELIVEILDYDGSSLYHVERCVPFSGCGQAWTWQGLGRKARNLPYEANLGDGSGDGQAASCECKAAMKGRECRHVAATRKLLELGKLEA
jgi:hypothetical protein